MEPDPMPGDGLKPAAQHPANRSRLASDDEQGRPADSPGQADSRSHAGPPDGNGEPQGGVEIFTRDDHVRPLADIEADIIRYAIGHYRGRMSEVARRLGIGRSTLYRKLSEMRIDSPG